MSYSSKYYDYTYNPNRFNEYSAYDNLGSTRANMFNKAYKDYDKVREQQIADMYRYKQEPTAKRSVVDRVFDTLSIGQYAVHGAITEATKGYEESGLIGGFAGAVEGVGKGLWAGASGIVPFAKGNEDWEYNTGDSLNALSGGKWDEIGNDTWYGKLGKGVTEFAGDVLLDPTTYVGGSVARGMIKGTGKKVAGKETLEAISKSTVQDMLEKSGKMHKYTDAGVARATEKINSAKGIAKGTGDVTFFGKKMIDGTALRELGDRTIAPYYNAMTSALRDSGAGKLFNNSYHLRQFAMESPDKALEFVDYLNDLGGLKKTKMLKDDNVRKVYDKMMESFTDEQRKQITHFIENPKMYDDVTTWEKGVQGTDFYKQFEEVVSPLMQEVGVLRKEQRSLATIKDQIGKVFDKDGAKFWDNLTDLNNKYTKGKLKDILDPTNQYKSFEEVLDNLHPSDTYKLFSEFEGTPFDLVDGLTDDVIEEVTEGAMDGQIGLFDYTGKDNKEVTDTLNSLKAEGIRKKEQQRLSSLDAQRQQIEIRKSVEEKVGYIPKVNESNILQQSELMTQNPKLKASLVGRKPEYKAQVLNELLFNGQEVISSTASNKTLNNLIKVLQSGDVKQLQSLAFSTTQEGMDMYKYLMGKYGTEMLDLPTSHIKVNMDADKFAYDMLSGDVNMDEVLEKVNQGYNKTGVQVYKTVGEMKERFASYEKAYNQLTYQKLVAEYQNELADLDKMLGMAEDVKSRDKVRNQILNTKKRFAERSEQVTGKKQQLPKGKQQWDDVLERQLRETEQQFYSAKQPFDDRQNELNYVRSLSKDQYAFFREKFGTTPFHKINERDLDAVARMTVDDIERVFLEEGVSASEKAVKYRRGDSTKEFDDMSEKLNQLEDVKRKRAETTDKSYDTRGAVEKQMFDKDDYKAQMKPLRNSTVPVTDGKGGYVKDAEGRVLRETRPSKVSRDIDNYIEKTVNALHFEYGDIPFEEREKLAKRYEQVGKDIKDWLEGKEGIYALSPEEILRDLNNSKNGITIQLTPKSERYLLAPLGKGGMVAYSEAMPFIPGTNTEDMLRSVMALATGNKVQILDSKGAKLTSNLGEAVRTKTLRDGRVVKDYVLNDMGKRVKEPQNTFYLSKNKQKQYAKNMISTELVENAVKEVQEKGAVETLQQVENVVDGVNPSLDELKKVIAKPQDEIVHGTKVKTPDNIDPNTGEVLYDLHDKELFKEIYEGEQLSFADIRKTSIAEGQVKQFGIQVGVQEELDVIANQIDELGEQIRLYENALNDDEMLTTMFNEKFKFGDVDVQEGIPYLKKISKRLANGETLQDDFVETMNTMINEFRRMGEDEAKLGLLNSYVKRYATHVVNPEVWELPEVMDKLKKYDEKLYDKMLKYREGKTNPFDQSRKLKGNIKDVNDNMRKAFRSAGLEWNGDFFIEDISEIYLARALKHNQLLYTDEFLQRTFNSFGEKFDLNSTSLPKGKYYIGQTDLKKMMKSAPVQIQQELLEKLGLNADRPLYAPLIQVDEVMGKELAGVLQKYDLQLSMTAYQLDDAVVNKLQNTGKVQQTKDMNSFLKVYDKALQLWKQNVTLVMPGFHVRNAFSNMFQNYLSVGAQAYDPKFAVQVHKIMQGGTEELVTKNGKKYTYDEIKRLAEVYEVTSSGMFENDFKTRVSKAGGLLDYINPKLKSIDPTNADEFIPYKLGKKAGNKVENFGRMQNFVTHLQNGLEVEDAVDMVNHFLFDYTDLTPFEHQVMKRVIPFYTWVRKNAPLQMEQLLENPGRYSIIAKAYNGVENVMPSGDRVDKKYLPEFMQDWVQLPLTVTNPEGRDEIVMFNPNMPYESLNDLNPNPKEAVKNVIGKLTPFAKVPIEMALGYNMFFESPIYNKGDYLLEQTGGLNAVVDAFDKKGLEDGSLDRMLHLLNAGAGIKFSTYDYDKYTQHKRPSK